MYVILSVAMAILKTLKTVSAIDEVYPKLSITPAN